MVVIVSAVFGDPHARGLPHISRYYGCGACDVIRRHRNCAQASTGPPTCNLARFAPIWLTAPGRELVPARFSEKFSGFEPLGILMDF